ncbi:anti-sigma factor [Asanoa sp. WMMD1127]|uniref:anti-sigma factor n=1 Tax=Asanoa sp. WMMD1127 TaxID=3016107 RepID=UPI00241790B6|nr:anti-sigma factor [Asanoa sp. WMMD1127]MDG4821695.1 anti-sigma factor [Asanoa sp. WMMD1127]
MQHLDPDRLVLLALAEQTEAPSELDHLTTCAVCRHELESLRTVAELGVESQDLRDLPPPPERIWQRIEADLTPASPAITHVAEPSRRSRPRWLMPALAAAAAAVLAVAGTVAVDRFVSRAPAERVTARATLSPLPTVPATAGGTVQVLSAGEMRIEVRHLPLTTGFHEVWLIDPDEPTRMVAVGNLSDRPDALLTVPPGVDLNRYRLVDVSDEPHDGDAAHSGRSLLRGTLTY